MLARANGQGKHFIHAREKNLLDAAKNDTLARGNEGGEYVILDRVEKSC